jgi:signal transduction histidine kinase
MVASMETPNPSMVSRLVRAAALWTIPALALAGMLLTWLYRDTIYQSFDDPLEQAVTDLIAAVEVLPDGRLALAREPIDPKYQRALSGRYWLVGKADDVERITPLLASRSLYGETLPIDPRDRANLRRASGEAVRFSTVSPDQEQPLRAIGRQVALEGVDQPIIALAAADRAATTRSIVRFAVTSIGVLMLLSLGILAAIYAQVRLGLRPLFYLADQVAAVREGRSDNVQGRYPAEIAGVAEELNSLIVHNRNVVERAQTHVGNLAHGLKTPIAVLQNEASAGLAIDPAIVARQTNAMRGQVDHHLRRARAAARGQAIGLTSSVDDVLSGIARTLPRIYRDKALSVDVDGDANLRFRGDKRDLEDMVGNLMDNAAKWTSSLVEVTRGAVGEKLQIIVEDDGPGIPEDEIETALKRGARLDEATPGSGLGLAIVDDLALAYGGSLSLSRSPLGGLRAELVLPRAQ